MCKRGTLFVTRQGAPHQRAHSATSGMVGISCRLRETRRSDGHTCPFFSCAATASEMSPWGKFLLAAVGAAPAFLVTSIASTQPAVSRPWTPAGGADASRRAPAASGMWVGKVT